MWMFTLSTTPLDLWEPFKNGYVIMGPLPKHLTDASGQINFQHLIDDAISEVDKLIPSIDIDFADGARFRGTKPNGTAYVHLACEVQYSAEAFASWNLSRK